MIPEVEEGGIGPTSSAKVIINYSHLYLLFLPPLLRNDLAIAAQVLRPPRI
jgi:hypothetical protein